MFKGPDPEVNLHVCSSGRPEIHRRLLFQDWQRSHGADRDRYARAKMAASPQMIVRFARPARRTGMKRFILTLTTVVMLAIPAYADNKVLVNTDSSGVALQGYDPVGFFADNMPEKGDPKFVTKRDGAIYFFASKAHKDLFLKNPAKYEPCYGGYCAYGVSRKKLVEIDVTAFQIVDGKLLLQYDKDIRDDFNKDAHGNMAKADANWPVLVEKKGK